MFQSEVVSLLNEIADILDIQDDKYRPRAYRRAARGIENYRMDLVEAVEKGELTSISGVGESIASKIEEYFHTGEIGYLQNLREEIPSGVAELLQIPEVGPKTALMLHQELGVSSVDDLEEAIKDEKLRSLKGLGSKTEENILRGIKLLRSRSERMLLGKALPIAMNIRDELESAPEVARISLAGSIRRMKETVGDVDILVTTDSALEVMEKFSSMTMVQNVVAKGETKSTVILDNQLQVDLRIVPDRCFGSALQYFTGSKDHNIRMREIAQRRNLKLSEYGLFEEQGERVAGETEESVYRYLNMDYVEPELRENRGEIEASVEHELPDLLTLDQIRGDFHIHSSWSDGSNSLREIAKAGKGKGYAFLCITDHSKSLKIAGGLDEQRVEEQREEIDSINQGSDGFKMLSGLEVDILPDGSLDMEAELLEQLDIVIASIHSKFSSDSEEMTDRITRALDTGLVDILGHPTGRLLQQREAYNFEADEVFRRAVDTNTCMEINAFPNRLDLDDRMSRAAAEAGVKIAIGTDSHHVNQLNNMRFGVGVARRAWLTREQVANCMDIEDVLGLG